MFIIVRLIIGIIFFVCLTLITKNAKRIKKTKLYIISIVITTALVIILAVLPFENLFVTFDSPESAYEYYCFGEPNIVLIVEGNNCALVVDRQDSSNKHLILPRKENGWGVGIGLNTRLTTQKISNDITAITFQYKNTNDFFLAIYDINGEELQIQDNQNATVFTMSKENNYLNKAFFEYYVYTSDIDSYIDWLAKGNIKKTGDGSLS